MSDLIDRQRAIEAVKLGITYAKLIDTETGELLEPFKASNDELKRAVQRIKNLPSAQPTFDARDTQYNLPIGTDLISRQAAIERFDYIRPRDPMTSDYTHGIDVGIALCKVAIREQPPAQHGTNLASLGTDCISRQQAIKTVGWYSCHSGDELLFADNALRQLPPIQSEIIRCRECKFASGDSRICMKFGHSPIGELDFCAWAERRTDG